uniref:Uncharacterized protein n=1 Tax=Musa acuminata subsp. malaccensis TaxID=214687 RepID=A0A804II03_MUSAM
MQRGMFYAYLKRLCALSERWSPRQVPGAGGLQHDGGSPRQARPGQRRHRNLPQQRHRFQPPRMSTVPPLPIPFSSSLHHLLG